jgi:Domain of unknown function (DUF4258)
MEIDKIEFTSHALLRMAERGVTKAQVVEVLVHPREKVLANGDRFEARGLLERDGKIMLLRVIYENGAVVTVITVVATSKLAKYGVTL